MLTDKTIEKIREAHERSVVAETDPYTPSPGDLVQLKSGGVVMTAVPYADQDPTIGALEVACYYDHEGNVTTRVVPTAALMPAEVEEPTGAVMQARVDALRDELGKIARLKSDYFYRAPSLAQEALAADDLLNDEETEP